MKNKAPIMATEAPPMMVIVVSCICSKCGETYDGLDIPPGVTVKPQYPGLIGHPICYKCWPAIKHTYLTLGPAAALAMLPQP